MTLIDFLILVIVAAVCGAIGQALAGYSLGGCTGFDLGVVRLGEAGRGPGCLVKSRTNTSANSELALAA